MQALPELHSYTQAAHQRALASMRAGAAQTRAQREAAEKKEVAAEAARRALQRKAKAEQQQQKELAQEHEQVRLLGLVPLAFGLSRGRHRGAVAPWVLRCCARRPLPEALHRLPSAGDVLCGAHRAAPDMSAVRGSLGAACTAGRRVREGRAWEPAQ